MTNPTPAPERQAPHSKGFVWTPVPTVLAAISVFILSQVLGAILVALYALIVGDYSVDSSESSLGGNMDFLSEGNYPFLISLTISALLIALVWGLVRLSKSTFRSLGFQRPKLVDLGYALSGFVAYFVIFFVVSLVVNATAPELLESDQQLGFDKAAEGLALIPVFISLVVLPPLAEETLARGFLFGGLRNRLNFIWAMLITSLLFGAPHLFGGEPGVLLWIAMADTFILSAVLCYLREKTGRLWAPILLHALKNFIAFTVLFIFKGA